MDISFTNHNLLLVLLLTLWMSLTSSDAHGDTILNKSRRGRASVDNNSKPPTPYPNPHKAHQQKPATVAGDLSNDGRYNYDYDYGDNSQYTDNTAGCCTGISHYLAKLADEQRQDREQARQYHFHLAGLVQTTREVLAELERSRKEATYLRAMVTELRRDVNRTRLEIHKAVLTPGGSPGCDCKTQCMAEARGRPIISMDIKEISLCRPMPIPNPSFEVEDRSWAQYIPRGFVFWKGEVPDGQTAIKVTDGGARQILHFPPRTGSAVIAVTSKSIGVPGGESDNYSIYCDVKESDGKWQYAQIMRFAPNHNWHERRLKLNTSDKKTLSTTLKEAWCYVMYRRFSGGTAYFDNVRVWITDSKTDPATCK